MTALILDAEAFVAVDNNDGRMIARLQAAREAGITLRSSAIVIGEVWRDPRGRQARLARLLRTVDVRPVDLELGKDAGELIGRAGTSDPIDATIVLIAEAGDRIVTSDPADVRRLAMIAGKGVVILTC